MKLCLIEMTLSGSLLILFILLARKLFGSRMPRGFMKLLWSIALLRLLIPLHTPFGLVPLDRTVSAAVSDNVYKGTAVSSVEILPMIWLFGAVFTAAYFYFRHRNAMKAYSALPDEDRGIIAAAAEKVGLRRPVRVRLSDSVCSPFTYGILKPAVVLPRDNSESTEYALCHELTHIKSGDMLFKGLLLLGLAVHWFNPVVWLMTAKAEKDIELACDERVMKALGRNNRRGYALAIISFEERRRECSACCMSAGDAEERIRSVMTFGERVGAAPVLLSVISAAAAVLITAFCGVHPVYRATSIAASESTAYEGITVSSEDSTVEELAVGEDPFVSDYAVSSAVSAVFTDQFGGEEEISPAPRISDIYTVTADDMLDITVSVYTDTPLTEGIQLVQWREGPGDRSYAYTLNEPVSYTGESIYEAVSYADTVVEEAEAAARYAPQIMVAKAE